MSDLISRRQIHDYIQSQINPYGKPFEGTAYEFGIKVMDYIENMTSPELPVCGSGKWLYDGFAGEWLCSHCHSQIALSDDRNAHPNFCPECGADMRKKVTE